MLIVCQIPVLWIFSPFLQLFFIFFKFNFFGEGVLYWWTPSFIFLFYGLELILFCFIILLTPRLWRDVPMFSSRKLIVLAFKTILCFFFSFFKDFIYLFMRDRGRGRDKGRGRSRLPAGSPMWDLTSGSQGHNLSQR